MKKAAGAVITAAVVGTAAVMAYSSMKPHTKKELKKDFRQTFNHMDDVKEELGNVRKDMTQMARTLKNEMR